MKLVEEAIKVNDIKVKNFEKNFKNLKVGIMGGTFNPIHIGHLITADYIKENLNLDKIAFVPTGNPPHKQIKNIKNKQRYEMVLLSIKDNSDFFLLDFELKNKNKTYTIDSLKFLNEKYKEAEFYFIVGADSIVEIETWKDYKNLFSLSKFVASTRPGVNFEFYDAKINELNEKFNNQIIKISPPLLDISSTNIRKNVLLKKSIKYSVLGDVENYIIKNKLYLEALWRRN